MPGGVSLICVRLGQVYSSARRARRINLADGRTIYSPSSVEIITTLAASHRLIIDADIIKSSNVLDQINGNVVHEIMHLH